MITEAKEYTNHAKRYKLDHHEVQQSVASAKDCKH